MAGLVFHVINRGVRRARLFDQFGDYRAFLAIMRQAQERVPLRLLAYCLMPNHFHFILWPRLDDELPKFMGWLTLTHSKRWHAWRGSTGTGPVYQGRYKAIPVQEDQHFLTVCRYVECNPVRAGLVMRAEEWPWSSLHQRCADGQLVQLEAWPVPPPDNWLDMVNGPDAASELHRVRVAVVKGAPYGGEFWAGSIARRLDTTRSLRSSGRPRRIATPGVVFDDPSGL
jgi:putative transposase